MTIEETDIGGSREAFPPTLWTIVLHAKDPGSPRRREALQRLIEAYWKPLYGFVRRKGNSIEASKDLIQGFFSELLTKDFLKYVDPNRGKFRTFLRTSLDHYLADEFDRATAQKRGGGRAILSLNFTEAEEELGATVAAPPDRSFKRDWAIRVMTQGLDSLRASFESSGRLAEFEALKLHLTSTHPEGTSYEQLALSLGISVEDVRNRVRTARARYKDAILDVIRSYTHSEEEARGELQELLSAFS
jgi:RNA polymerase sigma factor (sigma-70 family)